MVLEDFIRRNKVPVIFVKGTHYDIGFDVGRTFSSMINTFINTSDRLRKFETEYETENGKQVYEKTLVNMKKRYPFYVKEIQGTADGADVPFYKLFLLQMDDIIETINDDCCNKNDTGGCSSIAINYSNAAFLAHTEDTFADTLNNFYIVYAHIIPSTEDREQGAKNERFASLCYAGHLPGYTMGFTDKGLVFSINTLSPKKLKPGFTPRTFLTRAMLAADNKEQMVKILIDEGVGAANGFSLNTIWTVANGKRRLFNFEIAPNFKSERSILNEKEFSSNECLIHCNRYHRIEVPEVIGLIIDSSAARLESLYAHPTPKCRSDLENMISDQSGKEFTVFQNKDNSVIKTIAVGIFDLENNTWNVYIDKPNNSDPVAILPIKFYKLT